MTLHAAPLHRVDQRAEIAIAGEQNDVVDMVLGELPRIDGELDVEAALDAPPGRGSR